VKTVVLDLLVATLDRRGELGMLGSDQEPTLVLVVWVKEGQL
jgi:hypothetical protein